MPPPVGPPNDPIAPRCHGTLPVSVCFRAPTLRRTLSMLLLLLLLLLFVELPGTWTARGGEWADRPTSSREPGTELSIYLLYFAQPRRTSCLNPLVAVARFPFRPYPLPRRLVTYVVRMRSAVENATASFSPNLDRG